jgi:hypothetical protein
MDLGMANALFDVAVAAEGPASALPAYTLGNACIRVALIDRMAPSVQHQDGFDGRTLAVALGSQQVGDLARTYPRRGGRTIPTCASVPRIPA